MTEPRLELDPALREYATDAQWEKLQKWEELGSAKAAGEALGRDKRAITCARDAVMRRATAAGYSVPETSAFHMKDKVPYGFMLRGQSAYVDKEGGLLNRWDKTKRAGMEPEDAFELPDPKLVTKLSTMTDSEGKVVVQWKSEKPEARAQQQAWEDFAAALSESITGRVPATEPGQHWVTAGRRDDLLAVYPVGDHHLGMLSWWMETGGSYDITIGRKLLSGAFSTLTRAAGDASTGLVVFLGDFLHYDSYDTVTPTSRNQLDSDTRYPKMIWAAVELMRASIEMALAAHDQVTVIVEPGNHDLASSIFLALCLKIAYESEPRVTVDTSPSHFHYYRFQKVLIGSHHGHGAKLDQLPLIMATDRAQDWAEAVHRVWFTGHLHQKHRQQTVTARDFPGCHVEIMRILPGADAWAHQKGYRPLRGMEAIVYHGEYGEVARHTVNPKMLEDNNDRE